MALHTAPRRVSCLAGSSRSEEAAKSSVWHTSIVGRLHVIGKQGAVITVLTAVITIQL